MSRRLFSVTVETFVDGESRDALVEFTVLPGRPATRIDPPEYPTPEIANVTIDGEPVDGLRWDEIVDGLDDDELLREANEQAQRDEEDAADHRLQMQKEDFQ